MSIVSHPANKNYLSNWEQTFGKKPSTAERVEAIWKGLRGGNTDPNRCVCAEQEKGQNACTPHRHYEEAPYSCARCQCTAYSPAIP